MQTKIYGKTGSTKDGLLSPEQQKALDRRQSRCVRNVQRYWSTKKKRDPYPEVAMPTGFGKGRVVHRLIQSSKHDQILAIVGSKNILLDQSHDVLAGLAMEDTGDADFSILPDFSGRVVLSTWQGLASFSRKTKKCPRFGLVVIDEVHNVGTPRRMELLGQLNAEHVVGLTATAHRSSGSIRAPEDYGFTVVDSMPLPECIDERWLSPLMGVCIDTQVMLPASVRKGLGEINQRKMSQALRQHPHLFQDIAKDICDRFLPSGMKTVIVVNRVDQEACVIAKELNKRGFTVGLAVNQRAARQLSDRFVTLDAIERYKLPHDHPDNIQVLISPQVIGEGFDAPATECVIWAAPTLSHVRYTQVIGRGSRRCWKKKYCLIVDYVYSIENYGYSLNFAQFFRKEDMRELEGGFMYVGPKGIGSRIKIPSRFTEWGKIVSVTSLLYREERFYTREELISQLKKLATTLKRPPKQKDLRNASKLGKTASPSAFYNIFGSHNAALRAAGLEINLESEYRENEVLEKLKVLGCRLRRKPVTADIKTESRKGEFPSLSVFKRVFGSLSEALERAGFNRDRRAEKYTREGVIADLQKLGTKLKRDPTQADLKTASKKGLCASGTILIKLFGSSSDALEAAGFSRNRSAYKYTKEEVIQKLKSLARILGRTPTQEDIKAASKANQCCSQTVLIKMFGGHNDAMRAAKLVLNKL